MRIRRARPRNLSARLLALLLLPCMLVLGCPPGGATLAPQAGRQGFQEAAFIPVPGGQVNAIGGNFLVERVDLSIDTRLGTYEIGAAYNSTGGSWRWDFQASYDGTTFVDRSGAAHALSGLADGETVPGTPWVKVDNDTVRTRGGLVFDFSASGSLQGIHWASSDHPSLVFVPGAVAGGSAVVRVDQCTAPGSCQLVYDVTYDASGRVEAIHDRAGRTADFAYDSAGNLSVARDGLDTAQAWPGFRYEYIGTKLTALTNSEGERVEYSYNGNRLARVEQMGGVHPVHTLGYQAKSDGLYATRHTDPTGVETRYRYDEQRRLFELELVPAGEITRRTWSERRVTSLTDPGGFTTAWTYAGEDPSSRTDPSGNVVTFSYAPGAVDREHPHQTPVAATQDLLGPVETRSYDASGRLVSLANGEGEQRLYTYDAQEMVATVTEKGVTRSLSLYGEHGHAARVTADGVDSDRTFDAVGNRILGSDGLLPDAGGIYRRSFDEDRNLSALELQQADLFTNDSETITLDYRSDRQRTAVSRGSGADHEFLYDPLGRPIERRERVDGGWNIMTYAYDAAGRLVSTDLANGTRQELAWGPDGRNSGHRALRDGSVESAATLTWAGGRLASAHDSTTGQTEIYGYDASGRLASRQFGDGDELQLGYDLRSRLSAEVFLANGALATWLLYGYDLADRRTRTQDVSGDLVVRTYTDGRLSQAAYGNGVTRSFSYGPSGGLAGSTSVDAAGTPIEATTVELDTQVWISHKASTTTFGGVAQTTVEDYWLLALPTAGTPTSFAGKSVAGDADPSGTPVNLYDYDARSNLVSKAGFSFSYNTERNRLLSKRDATTGAVLRSYTYDDAGYVTDRGGVPLTWSAQGQLLSYGSNTLVRDAFGRVRASTIDGVATTMRWGGRIVADTSGLPLSLDLQEVKLDLAGGGHLYRHLDFRGNVKFTTDDAGVVRSHYRYTAYGLDHVHGLDEDGVRFATRPEIGDLMLMGARVYDPDVARFLSPDPVFQIVNQFAYTLSNPVWFHDRSGMQGEANSSSTGVAHGLGAVGAGLTAVGGTLAAGGTVTTIGGIGLGMFVLGGWLLFAAALVLLLSGVATSVISVSTGSGAGTGGGAMGSGFGGGSGGGGGGGGGGGLCSPGSLTALPDAAHWLRVLLPLQLLLVLGILRRRRW